MPALPELRTRWSGTNQVVAGSEPPKRYRADIQGLRAIAVMLVALNHAGVSQLAGGYVGVDVFFVVSGFVITGSLRGGEHRDGISLPAFYAARARRILPMATVVLVVTVIASWQLLNFVAARRVATDALWAGFFGANFHFSAVGTDYLAADLPPSPLQHYWSLAVEEQFYLVWPVLLGVLVFGITKRSRRRSARSHEPTGRVVASLGVLIAVSFYWSVKQTHEAPTAAFFSTFTRAWELAVGALLAISPVARVPASVGAALSWAGAAGVVASGALFTADTPFPGSAALLPVLSTAAIIAGGTGGSRRGVGRLLGAPPLRSVGNWSYSFYLWHWPVLIIAAGYAERQLSLPTNLGLLVLALALAGVTYRFVENPLRRAQWLQEEPPRGLVLWPVAMATLLVVVVCATTSLRSQVDARAAAADTPAVTIGLDRTARPEPPFDPVAAVQRSVAAARARQPIPADLSPPIDKLSNEGFSVRQVCRAEPADATRQVCTFGSVQATRSLLVIGDSHASMWTVAFDAIGRKYGWAVYLVSRSGCTSANVTLIAGGGPDRGCDNWRAWGLKTAVSLHPDRIVVATAPRSRAADDRGGRITDDALLAQRWVTGISSTVRALEPSDARITVLSDPPGLGGYPVDCLLRRKVDMSTCTWPLDGTKTRLNAAMRDGAAAAGVGFADLERWFCADRLCPTAIGKTIAYRDLNHVSHAYSLQLVESLARLLALTG